MTRPLVLLVVAVALLAPAAALSQVRVDSPLNKHNLSVGGPGPVKSQTITEVCIFCHTPHNASPAVPLWNQSLSIRRHLHALHEHDARRGRRRPDRFVEVVPELPRWDGGRRQHRDAWSVCHARGECPGRDDRALSAGHEPQRRPPDLIRARDRREHHEPVGWQSRQARRQWPGAVPKLSRPAPDGHRSDDAEVPGHEQRGVRALRRLPQPAVLGDQPEFAPDLDQELHDRAGRAHRLRHRREQRM